MKFMVAFLSGWGVTVTIGAWPYITRNQHMHMMYEAILAGMVVIYVVVQYIHRLEYGR